MATMKFDMHIHCGPETVDPTALLAQMDQCGIFGGVLLSHYPKEYKADGYDAQARMDQVLTACKEHGDRLFPVLWIHPHEPNVLDVVEEAAQRGILGFKIICNNFYVSDPCCKTLLRRIAELNKPVIFHSGILWDGGESSKYNRPLHWESLVDIKGLRFSMGHCSWPWHDECIAVYGKFLNSYLTRNSSEMFFDITPGTPKIYRRDLLTKLYTVGYDVDNNVMFGTDSFSNDYNPEWVRGWLKMDGEIFDELGLTTEQREKIYHGNLERFLSGKSIDHVLPHINK